jgi:hypothetical protein
MLYFLYCFLFSLLYLEAFKMSQLDVFIALDFFLLYANFRVFFTKKKQKHKYLYVFKFRTIWSWLPERFTIKTPQLIFTTLENGNSLNTLYNRIDLLEHCLIVIKTIQNEVNKNYIIFTY